MGRASERGFQDTFRNPVGICLIGNLSNPIVLEHRSWSCNTSRAIMQH